MLSKNYFQINENKCAFSFSWIICITTMILKAYKYRLYPNKDQREFLEQHFDSVRFVYNHFLERKIKYYKETKKTLTWIDLANELVDLKKQNEYSWLNNVGSQSLQQAIINLDRAYTNFFRSNGNFPKFKSKKKSRKSFCVPESKQIEVDFDGNKIRVPKFIETKKYGDNRLKCKFHRRFCGKIKQCTISMDNCNDYFVSILVEENINIPKKPEIQRSNAIGIDFGVKTFLTMDNGTKIESPKHYIQSLSKLKNHQKELETYERGSTKHKSKKEQISKLHRKISRQRGDFLNKLSFKLVNDNQVDTICIEDLSMRKMKETNFKTTNRIIGDLGWFMFTQMLQYKSDWCGKNFLKIGRFDPSSKTCNCCGNVYHELSLDERTWKCSECSEIHDRDVNAAKNILDFALTNMKYKKGRDYPIEAISFR
jgi:putative transposase